MPATVSGTIHGGPPPPSGSGGGDGWGSDGSNGRGASRKTSFTAIYVLLTAIVMFFAAFTSAFVMRRGYSSDWLHTPMPAVIWWNTAVLALSSVALEIGRRGLRSGRRSTFTAGWIAGTLLGVLFLALQVVAWTQMRDAGWFVAGNPSTAFFYVLTAAHAAHLLAGVLAMIYVATQALRLRMGPGKRTGADVTALYWHFLDGLWLYLVVLLAVWG